MDRVALALPTTWPAVGEVNVTDAWPLALVVRLKVSTFPETLLAAAGVMGVIQAPLLLVKVKVTATPAPTAWKPVPSPSLR